MITFTANSTTSTVASVSWKFGDGNTSTVATPSHRFAIAGTFTIEADITLGNGSNCKTSKQITVYDLPNVKLTFDGSTQFCFTNNNVCILDNSTSGNAGIKNTKRTILWGDGNKTDHSNPLSGDKICYQYAKPNKYTIDVELTNEKGCEAKKSLNIEVLYDFVPKFNYVSQNKKCESETFGFSFDNTWINDSTLIASLKIEFGDGSSQNVTGFKTPKISHQYNKSGNYPVDVTATFKNGCVVNYRKFINVDLNKVDLKIIKKDSILCYPNYFSFEHTPIFGAEYKWAAIDSSGNFVYNFGNNRESFFFPEFPGKYRIELRVKKGDCISFTYDSIYSIGVKANAKLFNEKQCDPKDTVYFCNKTLTYRTGTVQYLWKFNDPHAPACTTNTKQNINKNANCNFSVDIDGKHFYDSSFCGEAKLIARDPLHGCSDSTVLKISMKKPVPEDFTANLDKNCLQTDVRFSSGSCYSKILINFDSACGKNNFEQFESPKQYSKTCDTSRWVTYGILAQTGYDTIWRSCDPNDYYLDPSRKCQDTFWYHRAFRLNPTPFAQAKFSDSGCLPFKLIGELYVRNQPDVRKIMVTWNKGEDADTIDIPAGFGPLPKFEHIYYRSKKVECTWVLETDSGCTSDGYTSTEIGFYNNFLFPTPVCPGTSVQFFDTITYWHDTTQYWRKPNNLIETIKWEIGEGTGFDKVKGPLPVHQFDSLGKHKITMVSADSRGCIDTMVKYIEVADIAAGIKNISKKLLCDDIIQLFDSSKVNDIQNDSIIFHFWDFGDGYTPSFLKNPFHLYKSFGDFTITHVIKNTTGCEDTAYTTIRIEGPIPRFDIISDTVACTPFTVELKNNSTHSSDYVWYFGDTASLNNSLSTKSDSNVHHTYTKPGIYNIYLYAGDSVVNPDNNNNVYYCNAFYPDSAAPIHDVRRVIILPIPEVDFEIDGHICRNQTVELIDKSDPIYKIYRWYWPNDSAISFGSRPASAVFKDTGKVVISYRPIYTPTGPYQRACYDSITKEFNVFDNKAEFSFTKDSLCPLYHFSAILVEGGEATWDFGHPASGHKNLSFEKNSSHNYAPDKGKFEVSLISKSKEGCLDTATQTIENEHGFEMMIPNIITPNKDGLNDEYDIEMEGEDFYELSIYNRWGELMYRAKQDTEYGSGLNWNGNVMNTDVPCPGGTYFYILRYREGCIDDAEIEKYSGTITVVRD
ncbi:MAG: PKD domain-containing protein [Flavobacteriales bacterium]|nr:PKD domain-containing protein [Flavobacteriales bacterium]